MNTPDQVRQFLQWYQEDGVPPSPEDTSTEWVRQRIPSPDDRRSVVPFDEYDLERRLTDDPPDDDEQWVATEEQPDEVEKTWAKSIDKEGLEAFAWYIPFHFSMRHWGIYVDEVGLQLFGHLLHEWSKELSGPGSAQGTRGSWWAGNPRSSPISGAGTLGDPAFATLGDALELALETFLRHEWYHHQVELLAAHLEAAADSMYYRRYHEQVYQETFAKKACVEESLANAYVYRTRGAAKKAPDRSLFRILFDKSTDRQPETYRNYTQFLGRDYGRGNQFLGHLIQEGDPGDSPDGIDDPQQRVALGSHIPFSTRLHRPRDHRQIPIYVVKPSYSFPTISYFRAVQLETHYDIVRSDQWEEKYENSSNHLQELADNTAEKIDRNANLPGFNWRSCSGSYEYGRMNQEYRLIIERNEDSDTLELVDFGGHDMPRTEYSCY